MTGLTCVTQTDMKSLPVLPQAGNCAHNPFRPHSDHKPPMPGMGGSRQAHALDGQGGAGALGINAKYVAPNPMDARVQRFALQSVARAVLPGSRTSKCLRLRAHNSDVQVWKAVEYGTCQYAGLQTCGSVWTCPVCAAKIAERRRAEVLAAMESHKASGGTVLLLTLTTPHQRGDDLGELLARQAKAVKSFWADKTVRKVREDMGTIGQIRALEVTHGRRSPHNNGWHPHYHLLMFCGSGADSAQLKDWSVRLYLRWAACCVRAGLGEPSFEHGLKLHDGSKAAAYASKWGLEDEITKGHTKRAIHGETPFDLLRSVLADKADKQAAALFQEFAIQFKGKRQLHWSQGLKARFAIGEQSDEEISNHAEESAVLMGLITVDQWRDVLAVEARATVLEIAARTTWGHVLRYLDFIQGAHSGTVFDPGDLAEVRQILMSQPSMPP